MYEHILVPTDGSDTARQAVDQAVDIAEKVLRRTRLPVLVVDGDEEEGET